MSSDTFINLDNIHHKYFHKDVNENYAHLENTLIEWNLPTQKFICIKMCASSVKVNSFLLQYFRQLSHLFCSFHSESPNLVTTLSQVTFTITILKCKHFYIGTRLPFVSAKQMY